MKYLSKLIPNNIKEIIKLLINYIYPRNITCIICDNPIKLSNSYSLCKDCYNNLHFILDGCNKCGKPILNFNFERESLITCNYCYNKTFYFDKVISCIAYDEISKKLILDYKYKKLDEEYELALINKVVCVVEYMEDGSSKNMLRQYRNNPRGWCFFRVENLKIPNTSLKFKFKESIHYVSSSLMIKDNNLFEMTPYKALAVLAFPLGYLLKAYIVSKTNKI